MINMGEKQRGRKNMNKVGMWVYIPKEIFTEIEEKRGVMVRSGYVTLLLKKGLEGVPNIPT